MKTRTFYYDRLYATIIFSFCLITTIVPLFFIITFGLRSSQFKLAIISVPMWFQLPIIWRIFFDAWFKRPALVLTEQHIMIRQLGYIIMWGDIEHFQSRSNAVKFLTLIGTNFVAFDLYDPMEYIGKTSSPIVRKWQKLLLKTYNGPFCLGMDGIDADNKDIVNAIREYYRNYAHQPVMSI